VSPILLHPGVKCDWIDACELGKASGRNAAGCTLPQQLLPASRTAYKVPVPCAPQNVPHIMVHRLRTSVCPPRLCPRRLQARERIVNRVLGSIVSHNLLIGCTTPLCIVSVKGRHNQHPKLAVFGQADKKRTSVCLPRLSRRLSPRCLFRWPTV